MVGYTSDNLSGKSAWEGVRIVLASIFSTGRSEGALTFGFNPVSTGNMLFRATPLIMTGLSVAVAFKTGLFNIGAPGQYLMGAKAKHYTAVVQGIPDEESGICPSSSCALRIRASCARPGIRTLMS